MFATGLGAVIGIRAVGAYLKWTGKTSVMVIMLGFVLLACGIVIPTE